MAALYSVLALIGFGLIALLVLTGRPTTDAPPVTVAEVLGALGVFVLVYVVGAIGSAAAVFAVRPLRKSWVGWAATGALVSLACYSALFGLTFVFRSTLGWLFALRGVSFSEGDGFGSFLIIMLAMICVPLGAAFGVYWRDNPPAGPS